MGHTQKFKIDVTAKPRCSRYDLIKFDHYPSSACKLSRAAASLASSSNIIELYGPAAHQD